MAKRLVPTDPRVSNGPSARLADRVPSHVLGLLIALMGALVNKWSLGPVLAPDERITSWVFLTPIVAFQVGCLLVGSWLLMRRPTISFGSTLLRLTLVGSTGALLVGSYGTLRALKVVDPHRELRATWEQVNTSEDLTLALAPDLHALAESVMNLELPDNRSALLFADSVSVTPIVVGSPPTTFDELSTVGVRRVTWPVAEEARPARPGDLQLWQPLFEPVDAFAHAKFEIVVGRVPQGAPDTFEADVEFSGLARLRDGGWRSFSLDLVVTWRRTSPADEDARWLIHGWHTRRVEATEVDQPLFAEVLDGALVDPSDLARARRSIHEELLVERLQRGELSSLPHPEFLPEAIGPHPGLAVVDVDRDGFDDLYAMARWGENMLFRNRGDGTFEEIAAELGLNVENHTAAAAFADFDNDGDADVFLGRTLAPSIYLVNEHDTFVDRSDDLIAGPMPQLVSSVSAVDYDGDGLLDIYLSTYGAGLITPGADGRIDLAPGYIPERDRRDLSTLLNANDAHRIANLYGPPNLLLKNLGDGRFAVAEEPSALRVFRNSLQSTWADYDGDGDQDVYVANDFAPNNLLRNDGTGIFTDVTDETGTADQGFGMGASWGDYDNDGRQDLYVSNMYSKAGRRVLAQFPEVDPRFPGMARGNSLFRGGRERFEKVSGLAPPALMVEQAGWSWGGQFADFDNDGFLDIYALSGYYTAPEEFEVPFDG